ncbi:hypothetical protein GQ568_02545 [Patescibacteria group bacterium]|nr:hypothetical protein [Patescibacteria group bacterium]
MIEIKGNENHELEYKAVKALQEAAEEKLSIPQLCERTGIMDDYVMSSIMANLEAGGDAIMDEFRKVCREDGGAIHLSLYSLVQR